MTERSEERRGEHRAEIRLTIAEASDLLGISKDAIRMRIKRGTLRSEKTDDRVYVWLDDVPNADPNADANNDPSALIAAKDETIRTLREQLESERRANEENRRLLAGLIERISALEAGSDPSASQESPEAAETVEESRFAVVAASKELESFAADRLRAIAEDTGTIPVSDYSHALVMSMLCAEIRRLRARLDRLEARL